MAIHLQLKRAIESVRSFLESARFHAEIEEEGRLVSKAIFKRGGGSIVIDVIGVDMERETAKIYFTAERPGKKWLENLQDYKKRIRPFEDLADEVEQRIRQKNPNFEIDRIR